MHRDSSPTVPFLVQKTALRRASLLVPLCALILLTFSPTGFAASAPQINHVVIFWLKRPSNAQDLSTLAQASKKFRSIPGVLNVAVGPALPVRRQGIEQSFDLCVIFTFQNVTALHRFESDPRHKEAVKSVLQPLVRRYQVFNAAVD